MDCSLYIVYIIVSVVCIRPIKLIRIITSDSNIFVTIGGMVFELQTCTNRNKVIYVWATIFKAVHAISTFYLQLGGASSCTR